MLIGCLSIYLPTYLPTYLPYLPIPTYLYLPTSYLLPNLLRTYYLSLHLPIPTYLSLSTYTPIKHKIQTGIFCDNKMNVFAQTWSIIDTHTHSCLLVNRVTR